MRKTHDHESETFTLMKAERLHEKHDSKLSDFLPFILLQSEFLVGGLNP